MRTMQKGLAVFTATFLISDSIFADQPKDKPISSSPPVKSSLKLKDLIQEALDNSPALKAVKFEAISKESKIGPKGSYEDPVLGFEAQNYPKDTLSPNEYGMTGNQISLSQKIPFPGKLTKLRNATTEEYGAKKEKFNDKQLQLIRDVKIAFYQLFLAHKRGDILIEQRNLLKQVIAATREKYSTGKTSQAEVLNLQVEETAIMDQLLTAEKEIQLKIGDLNHLLGREEHHTFGKPEEITKTYIDFEKITEGALAEKILGQNPSLKSMKHEVAAEDTKLSFAKWNYLPDFEFKAGYTKRQPSTNDRGVDFLSGGVFLTIPIWAFSKQSEEVNGAHAEKSRADALYEEERLHLLHMVHSTFAELQESHKKVQLYETGVLPIARQSVVVSKSTYLTGRINYAALISSINTSFQAERSYNEALVGYESKVAELEALLGEPLGGAK